MKTKREWINEGWIWFGFCIIISASLAILSRYANLLLFFSGMIFGIAFMIFVICAKAEEDLKRSKNARKM
jgi:hypothetical protein